MNKYSFIVASALVCASASAFADNIGGNVFGVLTVKSKAADTIVAVPWCECSTSDDQAVAISNIVKTANLTVGDTLYAVVGNPTNKVSTWTLESAGGVKYWNKTRTVSTPGEVGGGISADAAKIARGYAIVLHRQNPTTAGAANPFYLYGQVGTQPYFTTTIVAGSSETPAYTLIAPPGTSEVDLLTVLSGMGDGDKIVTRNLNTGANRTYTYDATAAKWKYAAVKVTDGLPEFDVPTEATSITVQPGSGAWYVSCNSSAPTITWTGVPTK